MSPGFAGRDGPTGVLSELNWAAMKPLAATGSKMKNDGVAASTVAVSTPLASSRAGPDSSNNGALVSAFAEPQLVTTVKLAGPKVLLAETWALI